MSKISPSSFQESNVLHQLPDNIEWIIRDAMHYLLPSVYFLLGLVERREVVATARTRQTTNTSLCHTSARKSVLYDTIDGRVIAILQ